MKILIGFILGLFATVQTTPTVTQIPIKAEEDFVREAVTDGFIVEQFFQHSLTTEPPKQNITIQPTPDFSEGSGDLTSAPSVTPEHSTVRQTTQFAFRSFLDDGSGSGDEAYPDRSTTSSPSQTVSSSSQSPPVVPTAEGELLERTSPEESGSGSGDGMVNMDMVPPARGRSFSPLGSAPANQEQPIENKGHVTPDWIIILGFIVGVAALIMLCVAIATRDKWNGPKPSSLPQTMVEVSQQQREVEMETFLHKEAPKENGKAAEYTVIPLEDLPHNYSD